MMIYLHGINHTAQHKGKGCDLEGVNRLEKFVENLWGNKDISVVAEEFSEEACENNRVNASLCKEVASRLPLQHIYCDPNSRERYELGIPSDDKIQDQAKRELNVKYLRKEHIPYWNQSAARYYPIREQFWLTKLEPKKGQNVVFICGSCHIDSFAAMLTKNGWEVETV